MALPENTGRSSGPVMCMTPRTAPATGKGMGRTASVARSEFTSTLGTVADSLSQAHHTGWDVGEWVGGAWVDWWMGRTASVARSEFTPTLATATDCLQRAQQVRG